MFEVAELHARALPHTNSSKKGVQYLEWLYSVVAKIGYVKTVKRDKKIVGAISGIGPLILTLVVDPGWQRKGIGRQLLNELTGMRVVYTEICTVKFYEKMGFRQIFSLGKVIFLWRK